LTFLNSIDMKNKISAVFVLAVCMILGQFQKAQAWGMTGHRVIAEIAERHLTKKTKKNIKKIIGNQKSPIGPIGQILLNLILILN